MEQAPEPVEPANLRFLRRLVTVLTAVMISGLLIIIFLIVIRLQDRSPVLPETIALPDGTKAIAVTNGPGWYAVVTRDDHILIFDELTGRLRQDVIIERGEN